MKKGSNAPLFHFVGPNRMRSNTLIVILAKARIQSVILCEASEFRPFGPSYNLGSGLRQNDDVGMASMSICPFTPPTSPTSSPAAKA